MITTIVQLQSHLDITSNLSGFCWSLGNYGVAILQIMPIPMRTVELVSWNEWVCSSESFYRYHYSYRMLINNLIIQQLWKAHIFTDIKLVMLHLSSTHFEVLSRCMVAFSERDIFTERILWKIQRIGQLFSEVHIYQRHCMYGAKGRWAGMG